MKTFLIALVLALVAFLLPAEEREPNITFDVELGAEGATVDSLPSNYYFESEIGMILFGHLYTGFWHRIDFGEVPDQVNDEVTLGGRLEWGRPGFCLGSLATVDLSSEDPDPTFDLYLRLSYGKKWRRGW